MPPWPSRILPSSSSNPVESPLSTPALGEESVDNLIGAALHDVPVLRPPPSQASLNSTQSRRPNHGRSASHSFPVLLGNDGARRSTGNERISKGAGTKSGEENNQSVIPASPDIRISQKSPAKNGKAVTKEDDLQTGNCLTCDSLVRWPRQLDVYRCTNCLMINDTTNGAKNAASGSTAETQRTRGRIHRKSLPLTVKRTRDLVEQCITTFLQQKADEYRGTGHANKIESPSGRSTDFGSREGLGLRQETQFTTIQDPQDSEMNPRSFPPTRQLSIPLRIPDLDHTERRTSSEKERPAWKQIFTPLEDYLLSCLQDCGSLNASFALARPTPVRTSSEGGAASENHRRREDLLFNEENLFEFDAKTLLLGDIGENGQWWIGERQAAPVKVQKEEEQEKKPPRFDWAAIYAWYDAILFCGRDWRSFMSSMSLEARESVLAHGSHIDDLIGQGRYHVHRTFLKGIETILRRPHKPLQVPEDARFLVILLANPLLYPRATNSSAVRVASPLTKDNTLKTSVGGHDSVRSQGIANGHHSGIIKRILGLIANLPLPCHQALISWFCRVSEPQFRDLVELVGGFVSYRLTRQKRHSKSQVIDVTAGLIPDLSGPGGGTSAHLHAAIGETAKTPKENKVEKEQAYRDDWQVKAAAKVMSLLFSANMLPKATRYEPKGNPTHILPAALRQRARKHSQLLPVNFFYNTRLDYVDLIGDFETWEARRGKFSFCQYPMFLSIWAKIRILEYDARRQMEIKARDAFFTTIMKGKAVSQYLVFRVRRDCLADDSLKNISQIIGGGEEEIKKSLRIEFIGEEGIDAGGLRKEWFLLLTREVFDPEHGLFIYDPESNYCYFNPSSFETSDQFFLIGVLLGLAIYNSTILDISLPPFAFRKLLASAPSYTGPTTTAVKTPVLYTLADLSEWKPSLARGLQQLLDHEGDDVEEVFCRDFVVEIERYGQIVQVPLCPGGENRAVNNSNRKEFVDLYVRYLLDVSVTRQYEPFKRGFFSVCGGNALSLFRPEEIELLIRGSDEPLDTASIRGVAVYENCSSTEDFVQWFWEILDSSEPKYQREILAFITGSDRIPAMGATSLVIKIVCLGDDISRFPIARTCFNVLGLWSYTRKEVLADRLWRAVQESEGFGLK